MLSQSTSSHLILVRFVLAACLALALPNVLSAQQQEAAEPPSVLEEQTLEEEPGLADLDQAMCAKVTTEGLEDLNQVIRMIQTARDKGLGAENAVFAERLLAGSLMERATALVRVINTRSIVDNRVQKIRQLVISDLRRVIALDNPPPSAYFMLGRLMALPGGDPHEAGRLLTKFLKTEELPAANRAEALVTRARVQTSEEKALADFDEAILLMPEETNYQLARALFHRSRKRLEQSLADIASVLENTPEETNALILQGEVLREQGMLDEAIASFDKATVQAPQAPRPYQNRGEIYRDQGKFDKAIEQFSKVLELQPGVLLTLVHRAEAHLHNGQPKLALSDVELVLEKQPGLIAARRIRAEIYADMGRLPEAIEEMRQLAEAVPKQTGLKMQLALYYLVNKQPLQAIKAYNEVLRVDKKNFLALRSRGDAYLNLGEHAEAVADFERALEMNGTDTPLLNNYAWLLSTSPQARVRNGQQAVELATKACELTKYQKPHILSTLAAAYAESGDFDSAVKWSEQAVSITSTEDGDQATNEQLIAELASYRLGKPWREDQSGEIESTRPKENPPNKSPTPVPEKTPAKVDAPNQSVDL